MQKIVRKTSFGADPLVHHEAQRAELTRLILELTPELRVLLEQVSRDFSEEEGRPLSPIEVLERLLAENRAAAKPTQDPIEEARKDLAAEEEVLERAVEPTWVDGWIGVAAEQEPYSEDLSILVREHWSNSRLRFNKDSRHLTPGQRQEIQRRDCYTCSTPGCGRHLWLQVHHIVFYCNGGDTLPHNCLCLCSRCHKHLHDGHLKIEGKAPERLVWIDGRGERLDRFGGYAYPATADGFGLLVDGSGVEWGREESLKLPQNETYR